MSIKWNRMALVAVACALCGVSQAFAAATTAKAVAVEASKQPNVTAAIAYLKKTVPTLTVAAEKRSAYAFLGSVQEHIGLYTDAEQSYVTAAAIAAGDAQGMPKKTSEQLVLDAIRCALSYGDSDNADSYLNSAVRSSHDDSVLAYVKLYEQWSALCRAQKASDTAEAIAMLKAYNGLASMKAVEPSILLTLWHLTGEQQYADSLKKAYPKSAEAAIVKGAAQQLPAPFWYFVPRSGSSVPEVGHASIAASNQPTAANTPTAPASVAEKASAASEKIVKQQLGLFREEANAKRLVEQAAAKGFKAYITTETRPSGTTYFLVVVDENKAGTMGAELRNAGFDCYPVF